MTDIKKKKKRMPGFRKHLSFRGKPSCWTSTGHRFCPYCIWSKKTQKEREIISNRLPRLYPKDFKIGRGRSVFDWWCNWYLLNFSEKRYYGKNS